MKTRRDQIWRAVFGVITAPALAAGSAQAAVIYSGLQDTVIPAGLVGVYLDIDNGMTGFDDNAPPPGWDINAFFGGVGFGNSPAFQPARIGTGNEDTLLNLAAGSTVDGARFFATGFGGSETHLGTQFSVGQEGYVGFRFTTNAAAGPYFGWMRVVFTANAGGAYIKDWAYENSAAASVTARVSQSAAAAGAQVVTLSPGVGETFTLGSAVTNSGGNINRLVKTGAGTASLTLAGSYTGGTTISGGVLRVASDSVLGASGGVTLSAGATLQAGGPLTSSRAFTLGTGGGQLDTNGHSVTLAAVIGSTLTKIGAGILNLNGAQDYAGLTTSGGRTDVNGSFTAGTATVQANATTNFTTSQTLAALHIGPGATVTLAATAAPFASGATGLAAPVVPEPGALTLLLAALLGRLTRRPRTAR